MSIDIDKAKEAVAKILAEGGTETASVLWQSSGGKTYIIYPRTVAANVDMGDGSSALDRIRLLERNQSSNTTNHIAATIAARDSIIGLIPGDKCLVLDATGDPTVNAGSAEYTWIPAIDGAPSYWKKTSEDEGLDRPTTWDDVQGRPTQPVSEIDAAALQAHEHDNKCLLDQLAKDENGLLTFGGKPVDDGKRDAVVTSGPVETIPENLRDGGLLITITE